ncbi:tRNA pseudouridine(38-40) synthase TruA [Ornithinibacillus xuwenensis]|uniref:tRNA pseudouridine synthase A n=1 Tax=Ornithinibacillus xuwenensis TaxID=3144668 RepID=A0ABU9XNK9_9BACI
MPKISCIIAYDGTNYSGYQIQPQKRTVQGEIEGALMKIHKGEQIRIHASGRTDTGVHAKGQTIHFDTSLHIPGNSWKKALNTLLPNDVYVHHSEEVSADFHARYDVVEKEYRYIVQNTIDPDIFKRNYVWHYPYKLNIQAIQEACNFFEGTHDFTTFSSAKATVKGNKIRTLYEVSCQQENDQIVFVFRGSGFLYNMVRILVGTLLDVGQEKIKPSAIMDMLESKDRNKAGKTAPPQGLYLWKVRYQ